MLEFAVDHVIALESLGNAGGHCNVGLENWTGWPSTYAPTKKDDDTVTAMCCHVLFLMRPVADCSWRLHFQGKAPSTVRVPLPSDASAISDELFRNALPTERIAYAEVLTGIGADALM